jgi:predicted GNAT family acetyltransferase
MDDVDAAAQVTDDPVGSRLELSAGDQRAELVYRRHGGRLVLLHTYVPPQIERHGYGGALVRAAVAKASAEGLTVVPLCPFARDWLKRNPDVAATVEVDFG